MIRRLLLAMLLLTASIRADAGFYTDIWWKKTEPGWGVNLVQTDNYIFATFYIYGDDGTPTWVIAEMQWNGVDSYSGPVSATHGTFFGSPWDPTAHAEAVVGTATFTPSPNDAFEATFTYSVTSTLATGAKALAAGTSTSQIERFSLLAPSLNGTFRGSQIGTYTSCLDARDNGGYTDGFTLTVTQLQDKTATFVFRYENGVSCTFAGTLVQNGLLYHAPVTYVCTGAFALNTTATLGQVKQTSQGIEGVLTASTAGGGCAESARFSAALTK